MQRESFKSRLGFLLVSAGCAIGIGNVWRFPYVAGENGGGLFVLFYLIFLVIMGLPVLTMEFAVGRASGKSAVLGYKALEKPGSKWHIHGWFAMAGCYLLMMYYTTVSGWMLSYFYKFATGAFHSGMDTDATSSVFTDLLGDPLQMTIWMVIIVVAGFLICSRGLQNGLERISKFMMLALLALIVILVVHSLTLSGAKEGLKFYLVPNAKTVSEVGSSKCDLCGYEPVVLHSESGCCGNGDLRKLHEQRQYACRGGRPYLCSRYICCNHGRTDYLPGMLQLWRGSRCRSKSDLRHTAKCICKYGRRKNLGNTVLPVHDICQLLNGYRCI